MELSIIVPVYNVEDFLEQCLDSIYAIKGVNKEVIVVNDGSKDSSEEIIKKYKKKYPSITKVIVQKNRGLSGARNSGLKNAVGEYVSFIDSDDFIDPNKYVSLFKEGKKYDLDIIAGGFQYQTEENCYTTKSMQLRSKKLSNLETSKGLDFWEKSFEKERDDIRVEVVTNLFRRKFLIENDILFKEKLLHEDTLFMFMAMYFATRVKYFPIEFYYYRLRAGSIMRSVSCINYIHKMYIAHELQKFKEETKVNLHSWDSYICALYFSGLRKYKIKNYELFKQIKTNKKLTQLSKIKRFLIPLYHLISKEVEINLENDLLKK